MKCGAAEGSSVLESLVECGYFLGTNATVLSEEAELLTVLVDLCKVRQVLVHSEKVAILRGGCEEHR